MGLIETMKECAATYENAAASGSLPACSAQNAWLSAAAKLDDACTPRPPQAEWFEKWDVWWVWMVDDSSGPHGLIFTDGRVYTSWEDMHRDDSPSYQGINGTQDGCGYSWRIDKILKCLPVKADNWKEYPCPVGWQVVGGSNETGR